MEIEALPSLRSPVLIAAFEGWNDAAEAATGAVEHLEDVFPAQMIAAFDPEDYYDFQVNRPQIEVDETGVREIIWPTTRISIVTDPALPRDLVVVRGIEPSMRWRSFAAELLAIADDLEVELVVTLGALLADSPHSRPIPVSSAGATPQVAQLLGTEISRYEGPTGIVGVIQDACARVDLPALSLWAAVPHYVAQPPCPKATLALINHLEDVLEFAIPLADLAEEAEAWELGVDELAREDQEVGEYVRALEEAKDASDLPEASGESIAREFERYLRRRRDEG
jgi:proteasome assembly chaperone (PAC2) family protein